MGNFYKYNDRVSSGAGVSGLTTADGGDAIADNEIIRGDGTTGIQGSAITMSDLTANVVTIEIPEPAATTGASQVGRGITISASDAVASTDTAGAAAGGDVTVTAGNAARLTSGNANGGNINLVPGTGIGTGTGGQVFIPATADPLVGLAFSGDPDTGLRQTFANSFSVVTGGTVRFTFGSPIISGTRIYMAGNQFDGAILLVEANTAGVGSPNVVTGIESLSVFTNEGSTATNYHTLPSAAAGYNFVFIVQDADGLRITANTGDTIRVIDKVTAAAGYISSTTIGSVVTLVAINATEWIATSIHGVWTDGTWTYDDTSLTTP